MSLNLYFDGAVQPSETFNAPLTTHALHYGTGVFEGIRSYATAKGAAVFRLDAPLARMQRGAEALGMNFDTAEAASAIRSVLRSNNHRDAYVRPLFWLGTGSLGLDVEPLSRHLMVASLPWTSHLGTHRVRVSVSPYRRNRADSLPPLKLCGAYVNSVLAKREASARGFGEAMFVDAQGWVVECTGENVFIVRNGQITAVRHADALDGITRSTIIELTGAQERPVHIEELRQADEIFLTGTSAEVAAVSALDDHSFGDNPVTRQVSDLYARVVRGEVPGRESWLTEV